MVMDRNPGFASDSRFAEGARRVADMLWETTGGDVTAFPRSYLETLRHDYSDGRVSMLELIDRVDLGPDADYDDYCEVVDALMSVDPDEWPDPEAVTEVQTSELLSPTTADFTEEGYDFSEDDASMASKMEAFLKKVLGTVYTKGITRVTDLKGNPPSQTNNYLLSSDGEEFRGVFYGKSDGSPKRFPFRILENGGSWSVEY